MPLPAWKVWGFDLSELRFNAFSSKNMFADGYHLRKERFIYYQFAMLICLAAESTATYSLSKYEDLQTHLETSYPGSHLYNNDIIDSQIVSIVFCVFVAVVYGADTFFLAEYPNRRYPRWYTQAKLASAAFVGVGVLAGALCSTIIVARNSAILTRLTPTAYADALALYFRPPLEYKTWPTNIAFVVLLWLGVVANVGAFIVMYKAAIYDSIHGPEPRSSNNNSLEQVGSHEPAMMSEPKPAYSSSTKAERNLTSTGAEVPIYNQHVGTFPPSTMRNQQHV